MSRKFSRVLITGTTSGLGKALTTHYRNKNLDVLTINRRETGELGNTVLDICDPNQVASYMYGLKARHQLPDLLILNAGINLPDNVDGLKINELVDVWKINFLGVLNFISALQELKIQGRTIVSFSSTSNIVPNPGHLGYFLSKLALCETFKLLGKTDPHNSYKTVILSPLHTNIMAGYPSPEGLQGKIFNLLAISTEQAVPSLTNFFSSERSRFYFTKKACAFYFLVRLFLKFFPDLYKGTSLPSTSTIPDAISSHQCD